MQSNRDEAHTRPAGQPGGPLLVLAYGIREKHPSIAVK
nr:MAG TPA: hypothetical protein [Caudoviricetes sp.]